MNRSCFQLILSGIIKKVMRISKYWIPPLVVVFLFLGVLFSYRLHLSRLLTYPFDNPITQVNWYSPLEKVEGLPGPGFPSARKPVPAAKEFVEFIEETRTASLLVVERGQIIFEEYGQDFDENSMTNSMSMMKSILGVLTGIALEKGFISSIDLPISTWLPEWKDDSRGQIRLENLLTMTSGLRNDRDTANPLSDISWIHLTRDLLDTLFTIPSEGLPGRKFEYNNINSLLIGIILSRATRMRLSEMLSTFLWKPLGADDAFLWLDQPNGTPKTYCCFFAKPKDWLRFGQMILFNGMHRGKRIVSRDWIKKMTSPSPLKPTYGYQIWLGELEGTRYVDLQGAKAQRLFLFPGRNRMILRTGERPPEWSDHDFIRKMIHGIGKKRI